MFRLGRLVVSLMVLLTLGFIAACSDSPTSVSGEPGLSSGTPAAFFSQDKHAEERLKAELENERERIKAERELRKNEYAAARMEWKLFEKQWKARKKDHKGYTVELLRCEPQEYDAEAKIIGPDGGKLHAGDHELVIPKGALLVPTVISVEAPTTSLVEVELQPHGLVFAVEPVLTLSYHHCLQPENYRHEVVYLGERDEVLERLPSRDDHVLDEVKAWLKHFSRYSIAY